MSTIQDPDSILTQPTMSLYIKKGHKVTVTEQSINNGYDSDSRKAKKFLEVGREYIVEEMEVGDWSSTVILQELPNERFNSVHFIDI